MLPQQKCTQKHHPTKRKSPKCPECGSQRIWKNGIRYTDYGEVQRYLCRSCGHRFSDSQVKVNIIEQSLVLPNPMHNLGNFDSIDIGTSEVGLKDSALSICKDVASHDFPIAEKGINTLLPCSRECQVGVTLAEGTKNLVEVEARQKQAAGATKLSNTDIKGRILEYAWQLKKRGLASSTISQRVYRLRHLSRRGADLTDPESVSTILAQSDWTDSNKRVFIVTYKSFAKIFGLSWIPPKTRAQRKLPFIPTETEIDQLIAGCGKRTATFLQVLRDTGARGCEASKLCWTDIDEKSCTIRINHPVKGSLARVIRVSPKTIAMIMALPRTRDSIFNPNVNTTRKSFMKQRKRIAQTLQNPRLKQIHFHTFRHWKATMEYHRTKDILHVKQMLGHKKLENTEIYTHLIGFESDEWHVAHAKDLNEESKLLEAGFEYVRYSDRDNVAIYRKRK